MDDADLSCTASVHSSVALPSLSLPSIFQFNMAKPSIAGSKSVLISTAELTDRVKHVGKLELVQEYGCNDSTPTYQEASGAPVENISPLGLHVTELTAIFLNIGQMIGTGVFSTRKSSPEILNGTDNVSRFHS